MNTFNASSLSREGFPNKFKAYFSHLKLQWGLQDSLRSRRLEVTVGERENGHARGRHARPFFSRAHYFQAPATQATSKIEKTVIGT